MSDLISRQDAREAIEKLMDIHFDRQVVLAKARDAIVSLPSAEPPYQYSKAYVEQIRGERDILQDIVDNMAKRADRPTGRWVNNTNGTYTCDRCGCKHSRSNFCPNCGAEMEGGEEE